MKTEKENLDKTQNSPPVFTGIGYICKRCSGDGWLFHSKGGQSGFMKDCPKCTGTGFVKK